MTTWQPRPGQLKPGEHIHAAYVRKLDAIGMRRLLRQSTAVEATLRRLVGEHDRRWCVIVREEP